MRNLGAWPGVSGERLPSIGETTAPPPVREKNVNSMLG
jgi:hypothetical protein